MTWLGEIEEQARTLGKDWLFSVKTVMRMARVIRELAKEVVKRTIHWEQCELRTKLEKCTCHPYDNLSPDAKEIVDEPTTPSSN